MVTATRTEGVQSVPETPSRIPSPSRSLGDQVTGIRRAFAALAANPGSQSAKNAVLDAFQNARPAISAEAEFSSEVTNVRLDAETLRAKGKVTEARLLSLQAREMQELPIGPRDPKMRAGLQRRVDDSMATRFQRTHQLAA